MGIEELKIIMETLSGVSSSAATVAVSYFAAKFLLDVIVWVIVALIIIKVSKIISNNAFMSKRPNRLLNKISSEIGVDLFDEDGYIGSTRHDYFMRRFLEIIKRARKNQNMEL